LGFEAPFGTQFESEKGSSFSWGIGNLTNDLMDDLVLLVKVIPRMDVPLR